MLLSWFVVFWYLLSFFKLYVLFMFIASWICFIFIIFLLCMFLDFLHVSYSSSFSSCSSFCILLLRSIAYFLAFSHFLIFVHGFPFLYCLHLFIYFCFLAFSSFSAYYWSHFHYVSQESHKTVLETAINKWRKPEASLK